MVDLRANSIQALEDGFQSLHCGTFVCILFLQLDCGAVGHLGAGRSLLLCHTRVEGSEFSYWRE